MKIGFFDSGVGGATILKDAYNRYKAEYYYFADNQNSPFGIKQKSQVEEYTLNACKYLINKGCKIIVIACNTATSVAIEKLRLQFNNIVFIGTEPAIKKALEKENSSKVLLLATSLTIKGNKLKNLENKLNASDRVIEIATDKLVEFAERNVQDKKIIIEYLKEEFLNVDLSQISTIVLGCTHFPIFKSYIKEVTGGKIDVIDSSEGVVNNMIKQAKLLIDNDDNIKTHDRLADNNSCSLILTKEDNSFIENFKNISNINSLECYIENN